MLQDPSLQDCVVVAGLVITYPLWIIPMLILQILAADYVDYRTPLALFTGCWIVVFCVLPAVVSRVCRRLSN